MRSVCTDVATFVVSVDGQVQAHELKEVLVGRETELIGEVEGVVLVFLHCSNFAILVHLSLDLGSN